jgi:hypothetical protein
MAANTWSFGMLKLRYTVFDDRVVVTRNVWMPFVLLAIAAAGVWCLVQVASTRPFDATMFWLGSVGALLGMFAIVMTPWLTPGKIVFTREGVQWGAKSVPLHAITKVIASSTAVRSSQAGRYLSWSLVVALTTGKALVLLFGNRQLSASTEPLMNLERSIVAVFTRR